MKGILSVYVDTIVTDAIDKAAKEAGISRSKWIAAALQKALEIKLDKETDEKPKIIQEKKNTCVYCGEKVTELDVRVSGIFVHALCYEKASYLLPA